MKKESPSFKIGLVQMRCEKADIADNLQSISDYIDKADARGIDILAFPEASLTGYIDIDPSKYPGAIIRLDGTEIDAVCRMTERRHMTALVGFIEENPGGKPFLTQVAICNGQLIGSYRKKTIKDEDADWFIPGETVPVFTHSNLRFGMAICSDIGNEQVFAECARQGAQIVFLLAAPGLYGDQATRNWRSGFEWWDGECRKYLEVYARKYGIWIAVATQAGRTVNEDFPGGGYVFTPDGQCAYATPDWLPGAVYLALDLKNGQIEEL